MKIKTGIDLVLDSKMEKMIENKSFIQKVFHPSEINKMDAKKLAGIFALKEGILKALDISSKNWLEIEITYKESGKPKVILSPTATEQKVVSIDASISHENGLTIGLVTTILEN